MIFRNGHSRRAIALLAAASHLALLGCSDRTPATLTLPTRTEPTGSAYNPDGTYNISKAAEQHWPGAGTDVTAPSSSSPAPVAPPFRFADFRGLYDGEMWCGAYPRGIEMLVLGASPETLQGIVTVYDPAAAIDADYIFYEFRGRFDQPRFSLTPRRILSSSGVELPGTLIGARYSGDQVQGRFDGPAGGCTAFTLLRTDEVSPQQAAALQEHYPQLIARFESPPATETAPAPSPAPPPAPAQPGTRHLPPEVAEELLKPSSPSSTGNPYFSAPSTQSASSWVPDWLTTENVKKYGGYIGAGAALVVGGILLYKYGGSSGSSNSAEAASPDPVTVAPSTDPTAHLLEQQQKEQEEREAERRRAEEASQRQNAPPIGELYGNGPQQGVTTPDAGSSW